MRRRGEIARRKWACTRGTSLCCSVSCEQLRLETPASGKRRKAMYADTWQSVYIRLPRGRGVGPTAYIIYASRVETVNSAVIKKPKLLDTASPSESPDSRRSQSSLYSSESTSSLESRNQNKKCKCFWGCGIARLYSTAQKKVKVPTVRYGHGALMVRSWSARGTMLVRF